MRRLGVAILLAGAACTTQRVDPNSPEWHLNGAPLVNLLEGEPRTDGEAAAAAPARAAPRSGDERAALLGPGLSLEPAGAAADDDGGVIVGADLLDLIQPATPEDAADDFLAAEQPSPFHRLGRNVIRGMDGTWSKTYVMRAVRSERAVDVLKAHVPGFPQQPGVSEPAEAPPDLQIRWVLHKDFYGDDLPTMGIRKQIPGGKVGDMLIVTAPPETLLFIDELLERVIADIPQIELEVRIVEVNLDDLIDWDARVDFKALSDSSLPFDPNTNPNDSSFGGGFPILDDNDPTGAGAAFSSLPGVPTSVQGFISSLVATHGSLRVEALLSLLQSIGATKLISSPTITVLNGHHATLTTGNRVPVFTATGVNNNPTITTKFEDTGVQVDIVPFVLSDGVIRVDLSVDVSAVTSEVPFVISGVEVANPVISQRDTGTTVHVNNGQVFSVGGLISSTEIETITKVPLLGDIPLLGWLFKSRSSRRTNTEIVFFITPRIVYPSEALLDPLGG